MFIYRIKDGSYGYSGHVINFHQDVQQLCEELPRVLSETDLIAVIKSSQDSGNKDFMIPYKEFTVRRSKVMRALMYLKKNSPPYQNIKINYTEINSLPDEGYYKTVKIEEEKMNKETVADINEVNKKYIE
jgi:hypothetical protein